jgi:hypothetical protein
VNKRIRKKWNRDPDIEQLAHVVEQQSQLIGNILTLLERQTQNVMKLEQILIMFDPRLTTAVETERLQ